MFFKHLVYFNEKYLNYNIRYMKDNDSLFLLHCINVV